MPNCSTSSSVSLNPAVSITLIGIPLIEIWLVIKSLVVPGIFVTMAFSVPAKAFNKVDFPTFGCPIKTKLIPFFNNSLCFATSSIASISAIILCSFSITLPCSKKSISSSGKSIHAST